MWPKPWENMFLCIFYCLGLAWSKFWFKKDPGPSGFVFPKFQPEPSHGDPFYVVSYCWILCILGPSIIPNLVGTMHRCSECWPDFGFLFKQIDSHQAVSIPPSIRGGGGRIIKEIRIHLAGKLSFSFWWNCFFLDSVHFSILKTCWFRSKWFGLAWDSAEMKQNVSTNMFICLPRMFYDIIWLRISRKA